MYIHNALQWWIWTFRRRVICVPASLNREPMSEAKAHCSIYVIFVRIVILHLFIQEQKDR